MSGVTRRAVIALCNSQGFRLVETRFTLDEALTADEVFISAASSYVLPVVKIDDQEINTGTPGELTLRLQEIYMEYARASLI
jgi:D-alanine transaminase